MGEGRRASSLRVLGVTLCLLAVACGSPRKGADERKQNAHGGAPPAGRWAQPRPDEQKVPPLTTQEDIERLEALGYAQGSTLAGARVGVTRHDPARSVAGLNVCNSGHEAGAYLMDMQGRVLHRWADELVRAWPGDRKPLSQPSRQFWRRVRLLPNGDLIAIWDGQGIARFDRDSQVVWARWNGAHHDLDIGPHGDVYVLTKTAHMVPRVNPRLPILEDFVVVLDPDGNEKRRVSLIEAFERSPEYAGLWTPVDAKEQEYFHTNSLELLDGRLAERLPAFAAGNVLVSMRELDAIAVVDLEQESVVWAATGRFRAQHEATVLDDGDILLFDNHGYGRRSAVEQYDPATMRLRWEYRGSTESPFFSSTCGVAQRLPGGNTLITESDAGRAFEVTPAGEIVWEYFSPYRAGADGQYVATLFEVHRLAPDFPVSWLEGAAAPR